MATYLYIFPHPDDESFGPAAAMHRQLGQGHEVHLLTLTRGGATKQRHKLGLSVEQMGEVRYREMQAVEKILGLSSMEVLDFPDDGLCELDPRDLETAVAQKIQQVKPDIVVTYPVHGISGFHDHLVTHAVVKRVYLELSGQRDTTLKRLAFFTLPDKGGPTFQNGNIRLKQTAQERVDVIIPLESADIEMLKACLYCYATYKDTIEESGVVKTIGNQLYFELFGEDWDPPLGDLGEKMAGF